MLVPQLEMHPLVPLSAVPGAPTVVLVQNSDVVPHWPQTLQQALSGHGFKAERSLPLDTAGVPGTWGPHMALATGAGIWEMLAPGPQYA